MLTSQKHLFNLADDYTYLNCATMSAQLKSVEKIGIENLQKKSNPYLITSEDFFTNRRLLMERFSKLIGATDPNSIAIIPSVSYGIATVANNIPFEKGDEILILTEQFPSNYYTWRQIATEKNIQLKSISAPPIVKGRGNLWNQKILESISNQTKVVSVPIVHWTDGTLFDLKSIRARTNEVGAYLIIDGTQSIGAYPFSVEEIKPDALICAGYKWLMGPYGLGVAYFGERFYDGKPIENNWINHEGSDDFTKLVKYNESFRPKAARYNMGESSNFILTPMLAEGIRQLLLWTQENIQSYCQRIITNPLQRLVEAGYFIEDSSYRAQHLFGIHVPADRSIDDIKNKLIDNKVIVSYRGDAIRVAPNVYNTETDIEKLVSCFI